MYLTRMPDEDPRAIFARTGRLNFFPEAKRATLELFDGSIHTVPLAEPERYRITIFNRIEEEINVESLFAQFSSEKRVREKDIGELVRAWADRQDRQEARGRARQRPGSPARPGTRPMSSGKAGSKPALRQNDREWRSHWVEIHKKFALPFVCLVFVLVAIPLGISTTKKGGRTSGFTISLAHHPGVLHPDHRRARKMAIDGQISPFLGMWGPNIRFPGGGAYLFARTSRESPPVSFRSRGRQEGPEASSSAIPASFHVAGKVRRKPALARPPLSQHPGPLYMRKYRGVFLLVFLALLSISVIVTFFERIDNVYEHNKSLSLLFRYIEYRACREFIHYILPVTVLTTSLLTLGLLTKSNEITAMKACGVSVYRLVLSLVVLPPRRSACFPSPSRSGWCRRPTRRPKRFGTGSTTVPAAVTASSTAAGC